MEIFKTTWKYLLIYLNDNIKLMINHKQIIQQKIEPNNTAVIWEDTSGKYPLLKTFR